MGGRLLGCAMLHLLLIYEMGIFLMCPLVSELSFLFYRTQSSGLIRAEHCPKWACKRDVTAEAYLISLVVRQSVFRVSEKGSFNPDCSPTKTS